MGRPKALLTCPDGRTFVRALTEALQAGGAEPVWVVGRAEDAALRAEVGSTSVHARLVINEIADSGGQLSSLVAGLREADRPGIRAVMMVPVDAPLVTSDTVATLLAVFSATGAPIVRARYHGRNGHPVIFSRALFDELRAASPQVGAKSVLRAHSAAIVNVDVDDPGVVADVDTPEDYRELLGPERD
jgi:molybdenum cofactor cytidylyltransferase